MLPLGFIYICGPSAILSFPSLRWGGEPGCLTEETLGKQDLCTGTPWKPSHRVQASLCGLRPRIQLGCEQTVLTGLTLRETTSSVEDWISKGDSFSFQCLVWQHTHRRLLPRILRHFLIVKNLHLSPLYVALSSYQPLPDKYLGQKGQLGPQETATHKGRWSICGLEISRWGHTRSVPPMVLFLRTFASAKEWPRLWSALLVPRERCAHRFMFTSKRPFRMKCLNWQLVGRPLWIYSKPKTQKGLGVAASKTTERGPLETSNQQKIYGSVPRSKVQYNPV